MGDLLVTAVHHRALDRAAEVAAGALGDVALVRVGLPHSGHLKPSSVGSKSPWKPHTKQWSIRGVECQVADADVVGVIPTASSAFGLSCRHGYSAVVDEAAGSVGTGSPSRS